MSHESSPTGLLQRQALEGADGRVNDVLERRYQYDVLDRLTGISDSHWGEQAFRLNGAGRGAGRQHATALHRDGPDGDGERAVQRGGRSPLARRVGTVGRPLRRAASYPTAALSGGCGERGSVLRAALSGATVRCGNGTLLQPTSLL
ncbi:hypothetical protein [Pectobacterium actinidiae]|uniref:hypothetical protein n=1 Tax=Pectobacterium actinidiae TaxID=1507808 RepID=UPI003CC80ED8